MRGTTQTNNLLDHKLYICPFLTKGTRKINKLATKEKKIEQNKKTDKQGLCVASWGYFSIVRLQISSDLILGSTYFYFMIFTVVVVAVLLSF